MIRPVFIIAANGEEFHNFANNFKLHPYFAPRWISSVYHLYGISRQDIFCVGRYWRNPEWKELEIISKAHGNKLIKC